MKGKSSSGSKRLMKEPDGMMISVRFFSVPDNV